MFIANPVRNPANADTDLLIGKNLAHLDLIVQIDTWTQNEY